VRRTNRPPGRRHAAKRRFSAPPPPAACTRHTAGGRLGPPAACHVHTASGRPPKIRQLPCGAWKNATQQPPAGRRPGSLTLTTCLGSGCADCRMDPPANQPGEDEGAAGGRVTPVTRLSGSAERGRQPCHWCVTAGHPSPRAAALLAHRLRFIEKSPRRNCIFPFSPTTATGRGATADRP
jgi:hypothetical protein